MLSEKQRYILQRKITKGGGIDDFLDELEDDDSDEENNRDGKKWVKLLLEQP